MIDAIITLALFALIFGLSRLSTKKPQMRRARQAATYQPARAPAPPPSRNRPQEPLPEGESRYGSGWYAGNLGAVTGEGDDPCHDDMGAAAAWGGESALLQPKTTLAPGIRLSFEANDVVKGILYAEILGRKPARRIR